MFSERVEGRQITVINTTHLLDPQLSLQAIAQKVSEVSPPEPDAIILVLQHNHFSPKIKDRLPSVLNCFGEQAMKYTMILTTDDKKCTKQKSVNENKHIQQISKECGGGRLQLRNTQRSQILKKVDEIVTCSEFKETQQSSSLDQMDMSDLRIVLLGKNVSENSRVGNLILGTDPFDSEAPPVERKLQQCSQRVGGRLKNRHVSIINSPQLLQTHLSLHQITKTVRECVNLSHPGPHVFILVLQHNDFTEEDRYRVKSVLKEFSEEAVKRTVVLTTDKETLGSKLSSVLMNNVVRQLIKEGGGGHLQFDERKPECRSEIFRMVDNKLKENLEEYLTCEIHGDVKGTSVDEEETSSEEENRERSYEDSANVSGKQKLNLVLCGSDRSLTVSVSKMLQGKKINPSHQTAISEECVKRKKNLHGRLINLVELPALNQLSEEEVMRHTLHCVSLCDPGVNVFLLIVPVGPLTDEDKVEIDKIEKMFCSREHFMVLFTTELRVEGPVTEFVESSTYSQRLISLCGDPRTTGLYREYEVDMKNMMKRLEEEKQRADDERMKMESQMREKEEKLRKEFEEKEKTEQRKRETENQKWLEEEKTRRAEYNKKIEELKREIENQRSQYEKQRKEREEEDRKREEKYRQDLDHLKEEHERIIAELRIKEEEETNKRNLEEQRRNEEEEEERQRWERKIKEAENEIKEEIKQQQREWEDEKKRQMREREEEEIKRKEKHEEQLKEKQEELEEMRKRVEGEKEEERQKIEEERKKQRREREEKEREHEEKKNNMEIYYEQLERERNEEWEKRKREDDKRREEERERWERKMVAFKREQEEEKKRRETEEKEKKEREEKERDEMKNAYEEEIKVIKKKHEEDARKQAEELNEFKEKKEELKEMLDEHQKQYELLKKLYNHLKEETEKEGKEQQDKKEKERKEQQDKKEKERKEQQDKKEQERKEQDKKEKERKEQQDKKEKERKEQQDKKEQERKEQQDKKEKERKEQDKKEQERKEQQDKKEKERKEQDKKEQERKEPERREQVKNEQERKEQDKKEQERKEQVKKEQERKEQERKGIIHEIGEFIKKPKCVIQ
ncbi:GTPase IMAP family member 5 [Anabarilius grahami]|uniref:GTPase IMAP family member 5 n=1 Tax=Anabarilius grahami TaxID=495550 RepID=A0A3N0XR39_ANAGA|nr:GTPase IMAP family member 5 [Anabarilius grahami]